jgi:hypothetical protein
MVRAAAAVPRPPPPALLSRAYAPERAPSSIGESSALDARSARSFACVDARCAAAGTWTAATASRWGRPSHGRHCHLDAPYHILHG